MVDWKGWRDRYKPLVRAARPGDHNVSQDGFVRSIDDPSTPSIGEYLKKWMPATHALARAEDGDWQPFLKRLGSEAELLPEERALAVAIITGAEKRKSRPPSLEVRERNYQMGEAVLILEAEGKVKKDAVPTVATQFKMSASAVEKARDGLVAEYGGEDIAASWCSRLLDDVRTGKKVRPFFWIEAQN